MSSTIPLPIPSAFANADIAPISARTGTVNVTRSYPTPAHTVSPQIATQQALTDRIANVLLQCEAKYKCDFEWFLPNTADGFNHLQVVLNRTVAGVPTRMALEMDFADFGQLDHILSGTYAQFSSVFEARIFAGLKVLWALSDAVDFSKVVAIDATGVIRAAQVIRDRAGKSLGSRMVQYGSYTDLVKPDIRWSDIKRLGRLSAVFGRMNATLTPAFLNWGVLVELANVCQIVDLNIASATEYELTLTSSATGRFTIKLPRTEARLPTQQPSTQPFKYDLVQTSQRFYSAIQAAVKCARVMHSNQTGTNQTGTNQTWSRVIAVTPLPDTYTTTHTSLAKFIPQNVFRLSAYLGGHLMTLGTDQAILAADWLQPAVPKSPEQMTPLELLQAQTYNALRAKWFSYTGAGPLSVIVESLPESDSTGVRIASAQTGTFTLTIPHYQLDRTSRFPDPTPTEVVMAAFKAMRSLRELDRYDPGSAHFRYDPDSQKLYVSLKIINQAMKLASGELPRDTIENLPIGHVAHINDLNTTCAELTTSYQSLVADEVQRQQNAVPESVRPTRPTHPLLGELTNAASTDGQG